VVKKPRQQFILVIKIVVEHHTSGVLNVNPARTASAFHAQLQAGPGPLNAIVEEAFFYALRRQS